MINLVYNTCMLKFLTDDLKTGECCCTHQVLPFGDWVLAILWFLIIYLNFYLQSILTYGNLPFVPRLILSYKYEEMKPSSENKKTSQSSYIFLPHPSSFCTTYFLRIDVHFRGAPDHRFTYFPDLRKATKVKN